MNKIIAIGHLGRDPEMRCLPPGHSLFYRLPKLPFDTALRLLTFLQPTIKGALSHPRAIGKGLA